MQIIDEEHISENVLDNLFMVYYSKIDSDAYSKTPLKEKQEILFKLEETLNQKLTKEDSKELQELLKSLNDINFHLNKAYFTEGIVYGAKLMLELSTNN